MSDQLSECDRCAVRAECKRRVIHIEPYEPGCEPFALTLDPFALDSCNASGASRGPSPSQQIVLDWLAAHPWSAMHEAAQDTGLLYYTVKSALERLWDRGLVDKRRQGRGNAYAVRQAA